MSSKKRNGQRFEAFRAAHCYSEEFQRRGAPDPIPNGCSTRTTKRLYPQPVARLHDRWLSPRSRGCTPWNQEFVANSLEGSATKSSPMRLSVRWQFMKACGIDLADDQALQAVDFLHQPRSLGFSPTNKPSLVETHFTGDWYDCSAHLLWIGDRTRQTRRGPT